MSLSLYKPSDKKKRSHLGASIVEMALVLPLFLVSIFFTIQIIRYFYITFWLEYTALQTVRWFSSENLAVVPDGRCDVAAGGAGTALSADCSQYRQLVLTAVQKANEILKSSLGEGIYNNLQAYSLYDSQLYSSFNCTLSQNFRDSFSQFSPDPDNRPRVAILRPGECAVSRDPSNNNQATILQHPTRACGTCGDSVDIAECINRTLNPSTSTGLPSDVCNEKMEDVLKVHPIVVKAEYPFKLDVPFLNNANLKIIGSQISFSNPRSTSPLAIIPPVLPPSTATPTPPGPAPTEPPEEYYPTPAATPTEAPCIEENCCWCECWNTDCGWLCPPDPDYTNHYSTGTFACPNPSPGYCIQRCERRPCGAQCGSPGGLPP